MRLGRIAALAAALIFGAAAPAAAAIVNISASDDIGTTVVFAPGSYKLGWIGVADGGLYNAAHIGCPAGDCTSGWTNAFAARDEFFGTLNFSVDVFRTNATYASPLASLAAYQAGPVENIVIEIVNGVQQAPFNDGTLPDPWIVTFASPSTYRLVVPDAGPRTDNFGGVSLSILSMAPVPEPATWAMVIVGFGAVGAMLRRRVSPKPA